MKKRILYSLFLVFICLLCNYTKVHAASESKMYSLLISGTKIADRDVVEMEKILNKNRLYSDTSIYKYNYDVDNGFSAGTTRSAYDAAIDTAFKDCAENDTAFFFHSGHGKEGFGKGWGLMLKNAFGTIPFSWYEYDDLLDKLTKIKCKHMIIMIHSCESGAILEAYNQLSVQQKKKISLFWSSGPNEPSYKANSQAVSVYTHSILELMGYRGNIVADTGYGNQDGYVTVKELGESINKYINMVSDLHKAKYQTPGYRSYSNLDTAFFFNNSIVLNKKSAEMKSKTLQLKATCYGGNPKILWESSRTDIATVDNKGKVTAIRPGSTTITAKANGMSASCEVNVAFVPSIEFEKKSISIEKDKSTVLNTTLTGYYKFLSWKSSNSSIVAVSPYGMITAKKVGTATVTVTANGVSASCKVTVLSENSVIKSAYKNYLKTHYKGQYYAIVNAGKDKSPILIVVPPEATQMVKNTITYYDYSLGGYPIVVFNYYNGKIRQVSQTINVRTSNGGWYLYNNHLTVLYGGRSFTGYRYLNVSDTKTKDIIKQKKITNTMIKNRKFIKLKYNH